MNFTEVRAKYPQYNDMSDQELATGLHKKYYSDLPFEAFSKKIGYSVEEPSDRKAITVGLTPVEALAKSGLIKESGDSLKDFVSKATKRIGQETLAGVEATLALTSGALLWPFSKAYGLMALPFGEEAARQAEEEIGKLAYQPLTEKGQQTVEAIAKPIDWYLTPSKMAGEKASEADPRLGYLAETLGEVGQFAILGGAKPAARALRAKIKPRPGEPGYKTIKGETEKIRKEELTEKLAEAVKETPLEKLRKAERIVKLKAKPKEVHIGMPLIRRKHTPEVGKPAKPPEVELPKIKEQPKAKLAQYLKSKPEVTEIVAKDVSKVTIVPKPTYQWQPRPMMFEKPVVKELWTSQFKKEYNIESFKKAIGKKGKEGVEAWKEFEIYSKKEYKEGFPVSEHFEQWMRKGKIPIERFKAKPSELTVEFGGFQTIYETLVKTKEPVKPPKAVEVPKEITETTLRRGYTHVKEFWKSFSTLPEPKKALSVRYKGMGDVARAERFVENIHKKLDKYEPEVRQDFFRFLDGQIKADILPKEAQRLAVSLKERTKTIGRMLVKRNIITQKQFDKHKGRYVHYMYAKHILGEDAPIGITSAGKLNLSYAKKRKDLSPEQKATLGLIEDASIVVPVGMGKALTDIAKYDYLETLATNPNWTWTPSLVDVPIGKAGKPVKMGIGKLIDEVKTYERVIKETPSKETIARHKILKTALDKAIKETANVPKEFTQLPNVKTYGPLAGAYIRKPIADDLVPIIKGWQNRGKLFESLVAIEQQGMALFKIGKVATNLPTATRNVVSNILQNNMRGRPLAKIPGDLVAALKSLKAKDAYYGEAFNHGLYKHNWAVTEINEILNVFSKVKTGHYAEFLNAARNVAKYYGKIDDIAKHTIFVQMRKAGNPIDVSILEAAKWGMDYSLASRSVKHLRQHIVPFISYQYKIAPLIAESLMKRPWVLAKYLAIPYMAIEATKGMHDLTDKVWKKLEKDLPSYIRKSGSYIVIPWKSPDGKWQWVNLEYFFPWGNMFSLFRDIGEKDMGDIFRDLGISNPFLDVARMIASAREDTPPQHPFYGTPIYNRLDPPWMKAAKMMEAIMFTWLPSMLSSKGALGYSYNAAVGEKDKWGREVSPGQAVGRWFGINIITISPKLTAVIKKAKIKQLRTDLYRIMTDPRKSVKEKREAKIRFREQAKAIQKGID